jgi:hypothetical protein
MLAAALKATHHTRIILMAISINIFMVLSACAGGYTLSTSVLSIGSVELHSGNKVYAAVANWVWSETNGLAADGAYFAAAVRIIPDLKVKLEQAAEIPWAADFSFSAVQKNGTVGEMYRVQVFNDQYEEVGEEASSWSAMPAKPGIYYFVALYSWGSEGNRTGYEYIFKVRVPG